MSKLDATWGRERLVATAYDFGVQNPVVGRVAGMAMWGFDIRKLFASIDRIRDATTGDRVLDVPCGGGLVFPALPKNHGLEYVALDYSPVMLSRARRKVKKLGQSGVIFEQGDVGTLPFEDGAFNLVLTYNGVHCFPDPEQALRELTRVVKPGGTLRGTLVVRDAGVRFETLFRLFIKRGYFGPGCTRNELERWLTNGNMKIHEFEQSGAILLFEATKR